MLLSECEDAGVEISMNTDITSVTEGFVVNGQISAPSLVIATGGLVHSADWRDIVRL